MTRTLFSPTSVQPYHIPFRLPIVISLWILVLNRGLYPSLARGPADDDPRNSVSMKVSKSLEDISKQQSLKQMTDAAKPIKQLGKKALPQLLRELRRENVEKRRLSVLFALNELAPDAKEAIPVLTSIVRNDQEPSAVRVSAMGVLRSLRPMWAEHLPFLVDLLNDPVLMRQAKEVLAEVGPGAQPVVSDLLALIRKNGPRVNYLETLAAIGPGAKDAVPVLIDILKNGQDHIQRRWAARALGKIGPQTKDVIPELLHALADKHWEVRWRAADALGDIGPVDDKILPALMKALNDDAASVQSSALRAIGKLGKKAETAIPEIIKLYETSKQYSLKRPIAAEALGRVGLPSFPVVNTLNTALKDPDPAVRIAAVRSLWQLSKSGDKEIQALVDIVNTPGVGNELHRAEAMQLLGDIGTKAKAAVPALLRALKDDSAYIRKIAAEQLTRIDPDAAKQAGIK